MTNKTYTHEEMVEEIVESIEEIGGEVIILSGGPNGFRGGFQLFISPHMMSQAELIVKDIQKKYRIRREKLISSNPFIGTRDFLDNF